MVFVSEGLFFPSEFLSILSFPRSLLPARSRVLALSRRLQF
jgi:hypothetical protein